MLRGEKKKEKKIKKKGRKRERKQEEQMGEANWLGSSAGETWCFMSGGAAPATTSRNDLETRRKKIPSRKQWTQKKVEREKTDGRTDTGQVFTSNWLWKIPATFLTDIQEKLRCWRARIGTKVSDHLLSSKTKWWKSHWHHKRDGKVRSKSGTNELGGKKKQSSRPTLTQRVTVNVRRRRVCALYTPVIAEFGTLYTVVLYLPTTFTNERSILSLLPPLAHPRLSLPRILFFYSVTHFLPYVCVYSTVEMGGPFPTHPAAMSSIFFLFLERPC